LDDREENLTQCTSVSLQMNKIGLFIIIALNGLFACSQVNELEDHIDSIFSDYSLNTPGVSIAVVKDGVTVFKKGYGSANLEYAIPINTNTIFHVASVSKQFTAFSIYLLQKEGKISVEDDIRKYFPELPDYGRVIRVKHLLAHTSGLRDQWAILTLAGWRMDDVITTEQIIKLVCNQKELNFDPGTQFLYSNTGYTLLAELIKKVSGKSFSEYTNSKIFQPLEMNDSRFYDDHNKLIMNRAYSYENHKDEFVKKKLNYSTVGATSLMTTVEDLAKWSNNFYNPIIGDTKLIEDFNEISLLNNQEPVIWSVSPGDTTYHAKGQLQYYYKGIKVISHGGHDAGFRSILTRFPDKNLSIIILSNDEHVNLFGSMTKIAEYFLKDDFLENSESVSSVDSDKEAPILNFKSNLNTFEGIYSSDELNTNYVAKVKEGRLILSHYRLSDIALDRFEEFAFNGENTFPIEIHFLKNQNSIEGFTISNFGAKNIYFKKISD
jgi:CubicO group peptidase (beta-lactamase class C family)